MRNQVHWDMNENKTGPHHRMSWAARDWNTLLWFKDNMYRLQNYEAGDLGLSASVRAPLDTYNDSDMNDGCSK